MNSKHCREIVFGNTMHKALMKLNDISESLNDGEFIVRRTRDTIKTNMRIIVAVTGNSSARGHRCDRVYVDTMISIRCLFEVIKPCLSLSSYNGNMEERISYFQ